MKVDKIETIKTPIDVNIAGARLLTKKEAATLPARLIPYHDWWWTSTADNAFPDSALVVSGSIGIAFSARVIDEDVVRPALMFESKDLEVGDRFFFGEKEFEVIKEDLAFCTTDIGECIFREDWQAEDANQYEKSDIKKYIDKWFEENVK